MKNWEVLENVDLKKYNTYGIGGNAKWLVKPKGVEDLGKLLRFLKNNGIPFYILGGGSNVILPDTDFEGAIIKLDLLDINDIVFNGDEVSVGAGLNLGLFINKLLDAGFTNMAALFGIPGSVGGAVVGNVGSFGKTLFDDLVSVDVMDYDGNVRTFLKSEIKYGYRNTEFRGKDVIILKATFNVFKGNVFDAKKLILENMEKRRKTQPLEYKNAGSVFRNPEGMAAGALIEEAGFKNYRVNDACVSEKHANFIINLGNAKSSDIIKLIDIIKKKIKEEKNIDLELEQVIVKW